MHQSSLENMQKCFERYVKSLPWGNRERIQVVDIGGANINGSYADIFSGREFIYKAADIHPSAEVDILLDDPYGLPFADNSIDILLSGQVFEHVEYFWRLFREMARALKSDGLILLITPSSGPIHRYPVDCYRFYPDAYRALAKDTGCLLIDMWHDDRGPWNDLVGVFAKQTYPCFEPKSPVALGRDWEWNRYERATRPATQPPRHSDTQVEAHKGKGSYLEVLKRLHQWVQPDLYLEIGVFSGRSLSLARCEAWGIDPQPNIAVELTEQHRLFAMTSDAFFAFDAPELLDKRAIDLAFIDGMHLFEFALRDFMAIERYSHPHTVVVVDDVFPNHPLQAERERKTVTWTGDVWKLAHCLTAKRPDLQLTFLDTHPAGSLIITGLKSQHRLLTNQYNGLVQHYKNMPIQGDVTAQLLQRKKAIDPNHAPFWGWLKGFLKHKHGGPATSRQQAATRSIQQWRQLARSNLRSSPKISVVVIAYNMARELPRTLFTLAPPYQQRLNPNEIEIIVVDNGSKEPLTPEPSWSNVHLLHVQNPTQSPTAAINLGLSKANAPLVGVLIDGARMASPGLLHHALLASRLSPRTVVSTLSYHLGPDVQMKSVPNGYDQQVEDELLMSVLWQENGYELFRISAFAGSSGYGWFQPVAESNALFMLKNLWDELDGYDERFQTPGGGLVNLDTYLRASELPNNLLVALVGEGTFHQVHGGIATNQRRQDANWKIFHDEYIRLRSKPFSKTTRQVFLFGQVRPEHKAVIEASLIHL